MYNLYITCLFLFTSITTKMIKKIQSNLKTKQTAKLFNFAFVLTRFEHLN